MLTITHKTFPTRDELTIYANNLLLTNTAIINITTQISIVGETTHTLWYYTTN